MLRGLYTAASGMTTQQRKHDTVTNNIANMNTPGFKQETTSARSFPEILISRINGGQDSAGALNVGRLHTGVFAEETIRKMQQGDLQQTGNVLDYALVSDIQVNGMNFDNGGKAIRPDGTVAYQPQALFVVENPQTPGDLRYTRNGKFTVDAEGYVANTDGYRVRGADGQPMLYNPADPPAPLVMKVDNPNVLLPQGNGLFAVSEEDQQQIVAVAANDQVEVRNGFVERSNVDPTQAMVDMTTAARAYEANQKMVQFYDRSMDKLVNEVGRV
ncbi:flagellar hook-basal body protein [Paenibacillus sp. FJAT-26967]|uniref:flagellar hook-basal body protein n=1 Tax=Paenibacillus sp. FJAT-26967 TaxID=1729690 RepID=UPI0008399727|nr:flagellar hook-basal body protein [Paenibacillus sp. FJAT-26967]